MGMGAEFSGYGRYGGEDVQVLYEYYLIKHFSHFVQPGAKRVDTII
jgi:hypothetical protein